MNPSDTEHKIRMDLHIHSSFSDSPFCVDEIFDMSQNQGLSHIAIADHDTIKGIDEIKKVVKNYSIKVIPAIEISAYSFSIQKKVHILAYGYDKVLPNTEKLCNKLLKRRTEHSLKQIKFLQKHGYEINIQDVKHIARNSMAIYKQHIMQAMIFKGYTQDILSPLYETIFKGNGICSKDMEYIDVQDAIKSVKMDGCLAVIAHPAKSSCLSIVGDLVKVGLDGLEINHPDHQEVEKIEIHEVANRYDLVLSGGSDYHGIYGSSLCVGCCLVPCAENFLERLISISGRHSIVF
jgi:phosphoribosyl 1,2-cyclic phosphate 1,2-diphosphodiesterase